MPFLSKFTFFKLSHNLASREKVFLFFLFLVQINFDDFPNLQSESLWLEHEQQSHHHLQWTGIMSYIFYPNSPHCTSLVNASKQSASPLTTKTSLSISEIKWCCVTKQCDSILWNGNWCLASASGLENFYHTVDIWKCQWPLSSCCMACKCKMVCQRFQAVVYIIRSCITVMVLLYHNFCIILRLIQCLSFKIIQPCSAYKSRGKFIFSRYRPHLQKTVNIKIRQNNCIVQKKKKILKRNASRFC